jgi:hypothetical protein
MQKSVALFTIADFMADVSYIAMHCCYLTVGAHYPQIVCSPCKTVVVVPLCFSLCGKSRNQIFWLLVNYLFYARKRCAILVADRH